LEQLRLSSVEREFRKRIAEYKRADGESGSVSLTGFETLYYTGPIVHCSWVETKAKIQKKKN
jgi:hypothetical protein